MTNPEPERDLLAEWMALGREVLAKHYPTAEYANTESLMRVIRAWANAQFPSGWELALITVHDRSGVKQMLEVSQAK